MKKLLVLISLLITTGLFAEGRLIFDLSAQHFSKTLEKAGNNATYNLKDMIVVTDMQYTGRSYAYGTFKIKLNEPIKNGNIFVLIKHNDSSSNESPPSMIRFVSKDGNSHLVAYETKNIKINNNSYKAAFDQGSKISTELKLTDEFLQISTNGTPAYKTNRLDFKNLQTIEIVPNVKQAFGKEGELLNLEIYRID